MSEGSENPKDAAGRAKLPVHLWPPAATAYGSLGMLEGQLKYGRNNFRATEVAASVYYAAAMRHLEAWYEGADDTDEGGPHLGNALACLAIIIDAKVNGSLIDDRNFTNAPGAFDAEVKRLTLVSAHLKALFADRTPKQWDARDKVLPPEIAKLDVPLDPAFVQTMNEQIEEDCQHIVNQLDAVGAPPVASDLYASDRRANE